MLYFAVKNSFQEEIDSFFHCRIFMYIFTVCGSIQLERLSITTDISWVTQLFPTKNKIKKNF